MRNSQISSVSSKFETWGLEKANLKLIDLSDNRKMRKNLTADDRPWKPFAWTVPGLPAWRLYHPKRLETIIPKLSDALGIELKLQVRFGMILHE